MADVDTGYRTYEGDEYIYGPSGRTNFWMKEDGSIHGPGGYTGYYVYAGEGEYEYLYDSGDHKTEYFRYRHKFYSPDGSLPFVR